MKKLFASVNFYLLCLAVLLTTYFALTFFNAFKPSFESTTVTHPEYVNKDSLFENYIHEKQHLQNDSIKQVLELQKLEHDYVFGYTDAYANNGISMDFIGFETISPELYFYKYMNSLSRKNDDSLKHMSKQLDDNAINKSAFDSFVKRSNERKVKIKFLEDSLNNISQNYLVLHNYTLKEDCTFFIKDHKNYLQYEKIDSSKKNENDEVKYSTFLHKEIPVLYLQSSRNSYPRETKLCIPIKNSKAQLFKIACQVCFFLVFLLFLYFLFLHIKIILNIANGKAFSQQNIRYLKINGYASLILYLIFLLSPYLIHLIYRNTIPQEFTFNKNFIENIFNNKGALISAIVELLLAKAFTKGSTLQTQSDLTI